MITGELRSKVDKIWETFWTGGLTNPLEVIEQFTYLLFIKGLDEVETKNEAEATLLGVSFEKIFDDEHQHLRWSKFSNEGNSEKMYEIVQNEVFPFIKKLHGNKESAYAKYMGDAIFKIPTPLMLSKIVDGISNLELSKDRDTKGDLYEYLLSKVATAGTNGQFRTPRHIIDMIVRLIKPTPEDIIVDPAAGSAGFLVSSQQYLRDNHSSLFLVQMQYLKFLRLLCYLK
ncbi:N-6 DNA methylase [Clostridioides difficile]|nr:N-6 DNA methylase [Clostridioides difficile]